ncbi:MAG TPA: 2-oxoglutarate dehydrogenase complex dihydrolipoyllysine-residue succinyltransferase [Paracoccaceae bacterium]|nr:2-oxoglutarate dehydrogenase complex dihydrolipoyllysine-residue succinyltransferase [Paracoccaceae bacterium]
MTVEVRVPTLGESVTEATVATWFKKPGDAVETDEMLCELETDKVTVEVPAPSSGTLSEIVAEEGATVGVDALLATLSEGEGGRSEGDGKAKAEASGGGAKKAEPAKEKEDAGSGGGDVVDVPVPSLGESVTEATVASWFKTVGDRVEADEMLCELETDKVSVEAPSPVAGVIEELMVEEGETVEAGGLLARIREGASGGGSKSKSESKVEETSGEAADYGRDAPLSGEAGGRPSAGRSDVEHAPAARRLMEEKGVDPAQVKGTGRDGRIMKEDVQRHLEKGEAPKEAKREEPAPAPRAPVAASDAEREERVKMTRLRQTIARRLKDAQNTAAMLTTYNEVDMTEVMAIRNEYKGLFEKKHGVKMGFMSFFVKACVHALQEVPEVNAEIDGTEVVYKNYYHMGVAVGTPSGLVVPVVRDADRMGFADIEKRINELGRRARDGKLSMAEMQGGTFTISNGGVYGSLMSSPILNPPQSGILGMHKIQERPMVMNGQIVARPMMYLALSYDHRIVDGKGAVTFLVRVKEALEDPRRLLMDL